MSQRQDEAFGRYRMRGLLGQGGMGQLFIAEQQGIQGFSKIVAVKRILPHLADSQEFREMFLNEARMAARLEHPNIVTTYELGENDGSYFISMEYLPGEDLAAILGQCQRGRPMAVEIAVALAQQSANGLHYAHDIRDPSGRPVGLVHRDVNPSNIFITYYGMVKLLDFGIVKNATGSKQTSPGIFKGKYAYCAPEQIDGGQIDRRTDVFSLGIVLWEALTNRKLFAGANDALTMDAVRSKTVVAPSTLRPDVPRELDAIALRALCRDRSLRFQSANEMSEALDVFLASRQQRPTSKSIGSWMESLFEGTRASLKKAIAQGTEVEAALAQLKQLQKASTGFPSSTPRSLSAQPRAVWSTSVGAFSVTEPRLNAASRLSEARLAIVHKLNETAGGTAARTTSGSVSAALAMSSSIQAPVRSHLAKRKRDSSNVFLIAGGTLAVIGAVVAFSLWQDSPKWANTAQQAATTVGSLDVRSDPPGAMIFVDGEPSGLTTPAVLRGLKGGRMITLHLDRAGYRGDNRKLVITAGTTTVQTFKLIETDGQLKLIGLPRGAKVYLDDVQVSATQPISVEIGTHQLRIEDAAKVVYAKPVEIKAGEQTIAIASQGGAH